LALLFLGLERYWHWVIGYCVIFADIGQYFKLFSLGMPAGFQARVGKHLFDRIRRQVPKKIYFIYFIGGDILSCDTRYDTDRIVVTVHMPVNDYLVPLVACTLTAATVVCLDGTPC